MSFINYNLAKIRETFRKKHFSYFITALCFFISLSMFPFIVCYTFLSFFFFEGMAYRSKYKTIKTKYYLELKMFLINKELWYHILHTLYFKILLFKFPKVFQRKNNLFL